MSNDTAEKSRAKKPKAKKPPDLRPLRRARRQVREERRKNRVGLGTVLSLVVAGLVLSALALSLSGRSVPVPHFIQAMIEDRVNARADGALLALGDMRFAIGRDGVPQVLMRDIRIADQAGGGVAQLNSIGAEISLDRLLRGEVAASSLVLAGAQITLRRTSDGSFAFRSDQLTETEAETLPELLERLDQLLATPALSALEQVEAGGIVLTLEDARSGRIWQASNATTILRKTSEGLSVSIASDVFNGTDNIAAIQMSLSLNRISHKVSLGIQLADMPAADIALQSPIVSWLSVMDAPISGAVRAELNAEGQLDSFAGTLDIAQGALQPAEDVPPVQFDAAQAYFTFDPARQRIDFSQISLSGAEGELVATGHAYFSELDGLWPRAFLGQLRAERLTYDGGGVFAAPVTFSDIRTDLRLRLDPFTAEIGQIVIDNNGLPVTASGRVEAREGQWRAALDARTERLGADRVLELWPLRVSPITRAWLSENLKAGTLHRPAAAVRFTSGQKPDVSLSFEFEDGETSYLRAMPHLTALSGRATMLDHAFALSIEKGGVTSNSGDWIEAGGSVFRVGDVRPKPAEGQIEIAAKGPLPALLTLLDNPPLRIMQRAGRAPDFVDAEAEARAEVTLPLARELRAEDVHYKVAARLSNVRSDRLVEGRVVAASSLGLKADPEGIGIDGTLQLDGVPVTASWRQPFGEAAAEGGRITGTVALSADAMRAFDLPLLDEWISGRTMADYDLRLPVDQAPELSLTSNLRGLSMAVTPINWRKVAGAEGLLQTTAVLGDVPRIDVFQLDAPGLRLDGKITLTDSGFQSADFRTVEVENWLNTAVRLTPGARGTNVSLTGGTFDLRRFDSGGGSGGAGRQGGAIDINLDRVIVSDGITLTPIRGRVRPLGSGLSGDFEARVNGGTPIRGSLAPANAGTAIRIQSASASGVMRDAGLTPNAREGNLDVVLTPVAGARAGTYDGQFLIENMRLRKAPLMADLLDAISVVGLIDQLDGPGIHFSSLDGRFRLTPRRIRILEAAAVGPSIGISGDGIYDFVTKDLDIRGVISPVYFLNGIGSIFTRRGEGLFGFNYRVTGSVDRPRVGVNPLSILTPGMFRRIFRSAPPGG